MAGVKTYSQDDLTVIAAWMYYQDGLTHQEIADELSLSRVAVTRLLQKARISGIVKFKITRPLPSHYELAQKLVKTFGIEKAIIVKNGRTPAETLDNIGRAGAEHLREVLSPGCRLGFGWSTTVSRMANYIDPPESELPVSIQELAGSMLGQETPYSISAKVAELLGATLNGLPVPVIVNNPEAYETLMAEPAIRQALHSAEQCDVAFVGLGAVDEDCTMVETGFLTPAQMQEFRREGAVGDLLLRYYDINGQHVPSPIEGQTVSLQWPQIQRMRYVVALAAGAKKIAPILGALRGKLIDCLVVDAVTAEQALSLHINGAAETA